MSKFFKIGRVRNPSFGELYPRQEKIFFADKTDDILDSDSLRTDLNEGIFLLFKSMLHDNTILIKQVSNT